MSFRKRRHLLPTLLIGLLLVPGPAQADWQWNVYGEIEGRFERLWLSHDASVIYPILGNPTSVLEYTPFLSIAPRLGIKGASTTDEFFDLSIASTLFGTGVFRDTDFVTGQVLLSDTTSEGGHQGDISAQARFTLPGLTGWQALGGAIVPYVSLAVAHRNLNAKGLTCSTVCLAAGNIDAGTEVIRHGLASVAGGIGLAHEITLSDTQTITLLGEASYGALHIADAHLMRPDLGPSPNIGYKYNVVSVRGEVQYARELTNELSLSLKAFANGAHGWGNAVFARRTADPLGPFPSTYGLLGLGVSAGVSGRF